MYSCETKYSTLLDLARQAKVISGETACLDGKVCFGIPFSGYPSGVDTGTTVSLGVVSSEIAIFSGNTGTTLFDVSNPASPNYSPVFSAYTATTWTNPNFSANTSGLTLPIAATASTSDTQIVGPIWTLVQTAMTGDYVVGTIYTGYSITYAFFDIEGVTGITGTTTATQENFSAGTLDYKGPLDYVRSKEDATIDGRLTTNKLTVTYGASLGTIGYVLTQVNAQGDVEWMPGSSGTTGFSDNYVSGGTYNSGTTSLDFVGTNLSTTFSVDVSDLLDDTNNYVTNAEFSSTTLTLTRNGGLSALTTTFTGNTSGDCFTDLWVSKIHSCSPLLINPLDEGNVYMGSSSGITFDITTDPTDSRIGINRLPEHTLDISADESRLYYFNANPNNQALILSGDASNNVRFAAMQPSGSGTSVLSLGTRGSGATLGDSFGKVNDGFIISSANQNGLNIIADNDGGGLYENYIRLFAGRDPSEGDPDMFFMGTGSTRGYVSVGGTNPNEKFEVEGNVVVTGDHILHSDTQILNDYSGITSLFKGVVEGFNTDVSSGFLTTNNDLSGNTGFFFGNFDNYPTDKRVGSVAYYGTGYTRGGSPSVGTDFYRNKIVIQGSDDVDGMVIKGKDSDNNATIWFEGNGDSIGILKSEPTAFGNVGFLGLALNVDGTEMPDYNLQIGGSAYTGTFKFVDGNQASGKVLTSDANGLANWQPISGLTGGTTLWSAGTGTYSITANNHNCSAEGLHSVSWGFGTSAGADGATAFGYSCGASGSGSTSFGLSNSASGDYSTAIGNDTAASGRSSFSCGNITTASGDYSFAEGSRTIASGGTSHAEGVQSVAGGTGAHAAGLRTYAMGDYSHSGGRGNSSATRVYANGEATFNHSYAVARESYVDGNYSTILGGQDHVIATFANSSSIMAGTFNSISAGTASSVLLGGSNNIISGRNRAFIIGGFENDIFTTDGGIIGGKGNTIGSGDDNSIITSSGSTLNGVNRTIILGGVGHSVTSGDYSVILGGNNNTINTTGSTVAIISSSASTINSGATNTVIIGGVNITAGTDNMVYVPDLTIDGLVSTDPIATNANGKIVAGTSDRRLKENIEDLTDALDKVKEMRGVSFNYTKESEMGDGLRYGFIAQEVQKVIPEMVRVRAKGDGMLSLSYTEVVPWLVEAIKELNNNGTKLEMYTPKNSDDEFGKTGNVVWDDDYIYIKTSNGWRRTGLEKF
jgi:hypothetical protein